MGPHHQVVLPGMDDQDVHRNRGEVVLELIPALAPVEGEEDAHLVGDEEEVGGTWVLDDPVHRCPWEPAGDLPPALPEILTHVDIGGVVVVSRAVE